MKKRMLHWELLGAAVGAGLASGREIASFFARYGGWSWLCIVLAAAVIAFAADAQLPARWEERWPGRLRRMLTMLLLIATGGGMLSGAGEVAALTLPVHGAYQAGMAVTLALAWLLARRTAAGLSWVSRGMLVVLMGLILPGLLLRPMRAVQVEAAAMGEGLIRALTYGGFNAALISQVLACSGAPERERRRSLMAACVLLGALLLLGNAVLLRHPALLAEPLPFVRMSAAYGRAGYLLSALGLYLAILSTLTACVKGLQGRAIPMAGMLLAALLGFSGVVEVLYPLLGGGCLLMLAAAKFTNYNRNAFHSRRDML